MMYRIADLNIAMECSGELLLSRGKPYLAEEAGPAHMIINVGDEVLEQSRADYPDFSSDEWEYMHKGFAFSYRLLDHGGFCLHAAAVAVDNRAVLFSGPCGTGKSTHAALWKEYFGPEAVILNDDRPALRLEGETIQVYGTPWSGKTDLNTNRKAPLQAVVFLRQAPFNRIERLKGHEAVQLLLANSVRPHHDAERMDVLLRLLDTLLKNIPVYRLDCTVSSAAVKLVYDTIKEGMGTRL